MIPPPETLTRATSIIQQIENLQAEFVGLFGSTTKPTGKRRGRPPGSGRAAAANGEPVKAQRRKMSPEGRARIAAAAKARWAKLRAAKGRRTEDDKPAVASAPAKPAGKKLKTNSAGRAAIVAAQKAHWATIRAEKRSAKD